MIVGIDSMVLIYAGIVPRKNEDSSETDELHVRARLLLHHLAAETIVLPAIAVSEVLVPVKEELRGAFAGKLADKFHCHPFDLPAAAIAASLWQHHKQLPKSQRYSDRHLLKADVMILASAKAAGATLFYTADKKCRNLAKSVMTAKDLPVNDPNDMFALDDIRRGDL